MPFETDMGRPSTIEEDLESLPDLVADALGEWRFKEAEKKQEGARLLLAFKAQQTGKGLTMTELKAMVETDPGYYQMCLNCVTSESNYVRLYERLMAAKKTASMRAAF